MIANEVKKIDQNIDKTFKNNLSKNEKLEELKLNSHEVTQENDALHVSECELAIENDESDFSKWLKTSELGKHRVSKNHTEIAHKIEETEHSKLNGIHENEHPKLNGFHETDNNKVSDETASNLKNDVVNEKSVEITKQVLKDKSNIESEQTPETGIPPANHINGTHSDDFYDHDFKVVNYRKKPRVQNLVSNEPHLFRSHKRKPQRREGRENVGKQVMSPSKRINGHVTSRDESSNKIRNGDATRKNLKLHLSSLSSENPSSPPNLFQSSSTSACLSSSSSSPRPPSPGVNDLAHPTTSKEPVISYSKIISSLSQKENSVKIIPSKNNVATQTSESVENFLEFESDDETNVENEPSPPSVTNVSTNTTTTNARTDCCHNKPQHKKHNS